MSICQSVVAAVSERAGDRRVVRVVLEIGTLAAVVPDALHFCFDLATEGTVLEGATLEVVTIEGAARCRSCGAEVPLRSLVERCGCGSYALERLRGDELNIKAMELEAA